MGGEEVTMYDVRFYKAGTIERGSYCYDEAEGEKPWTAEYTQILNRAVPRCQSTYYIEDIILEEAATYLSGIKTAEQAFR